MAVLKGTEIESVSVSYGNLVILDKKGQKYFLNSDNFFKLVEKHTFEIVDKKGKTHLEFKK